MKGALLTLCMLALPPANHPHGTRPPPLAFGTIEGRVLSVATSTPVADAELRIDRLAIGTRSHRDGRFHLADVPAGRWRLRVEAAGFAVREVVVNVAAKQTIRLDIVLSPLDGNDPQAGADGRAGRGAGEREPEEPTLLPPLHVLSRADRVRLRNHAPSGRLVDSARFDLVPTTVERDLFRVLHTLPSVTPMSDYSSALLVRGGTPDQTRIHLDGIPLHNPYHVGGFVSTFTPEAVGPAVLRPGGLAASVPSSLSGLLELETRTPGRDSLLVRGSVGLLSSSVAVDGPLNGGRGGFLMAGRRTYIDLATRGMDAVGLIEEHFPYSFSDLLTRLEHDVGSRTRMQVTGYLNREGVRNFDETVDASWGSDALGFRLYGLAGLRTEWEVTGGTSGFGADYLRSDERFSLAGPVVENSFAEGSVRSWIVDGTVRRLAGNHHLHAGARWEGHDADYSLRPDRTDGEHIPRLDLAGSWGSTGLFLRDRWAADPWTFDLGVRAERPRARSWRVLPRIRIERDVGRGWSLALAGGTYVQDWWGLRNEESALADLVAYEVLVPVPADRPLARGRDIVLEARGDLGAIELRADLFRKTLRNVPSPFPSVDPLDAPLIFAPDSIVLGRSSIRGVELAAEGRLGSTALALSYRYQNERRSVDGVRFRPRTERPQRLTLTGNQPWGGREVAFALTWMSGIPFTPVEAVLPGISGVSSVGRPAHTRFADRFAFGEPNGERVRSYLRLDMGIRGALDVELFGQRGTLEPYFSILNVLNRHNALVVEHEFDRLDRVVRTLGPQFPVLPSFGVRFNF